MVTDALDGVYVAEEDERHVLLTMVAGQADRYVRLFFRCSNDCCEFGVSIVPSIYTVYIQIQV